VLTCIHMCMNVHTCVRVCAKNTYLVYCIHTSVALSPSHTAVKMKESGAVGGREEVDGNSISGSNVVELTSFNKYKVNNSLLCSAYGCTLTCVHMTSIVYSTVHTYLMYGKPAYFEFCIFMNLDLLCQYAY
jgi:hypothetical protein